MTAGDAQRVWFSEMLEALASTWSTSTTWEELACLCQRMTELRKAIRRERGIEPPRTRCPRCGAVSQADISGVTIRSALFALKKSGVISEGAFKTLDANWRHHKAENKLDAFGRITAPPHESRDR